MRLTIKHYEYFKDIAPHVGQALNTAQGWDLLRISNEQSPYGMPADKGSWEAKCLQNRELIPRAEALGRFLKGTYRRVNSYGVGCACLEFHLKKNDPALELHISDFSPHTVERLKQVFTESQNVRRFDMLHDPWSATGEGTLELFYRVDTELTDEQWRDVFRGMSENRVTEILFIPAEILSWHKMIYQLTRTMLKRLRGQKLTFAGYLRTESRICSLFENSYKIVEVKDLGGLKGYLLRLKN